MISKVPIALECIPNPTRRVKQYANQPKLFSEKIIKYNKKSDMTNRHNIDFQFI